MRRHVLFTTTVLVLGAVTGGSAVPSAARAASRIPRRTSTVWTPTPAVPLSTDNHGND